MIRIEGNKSALYQWDLNRRIVLTDINPGIQVHFSHEHFKEGEYADKCPVLYSYKDEDGNVYANIPNIFLQKSGIITVYIYVEENDKAYTEHHGEILVLNRPKPADYVYTETEVWNYNKLEERVTKLEQHGGGGAVDTELVEQIVEDYLIENPPPPGEKGDKGDPGKDGNDGYTPVKGVDYYTEADKIEMLNAVITALPKYNGEVVDV